MLCSYDIRPKIEPNAYRLTLMIDLHVCKSCSLIISYTVRKKLSKICNVRLLIINNNRLHLVPEILQRAYQLDPSDVEISLSVEIVLKKLQR